MANLNTKTISDGVGDILAVDGGIDASTVRQIKDGDGTGSPFYITTTKVGIGTDSPAHTLEVKGSESTLARFYDSSNGSIGQIEIGTMDIKVDNNKMQFRDGADTPILTITDDEYVGIGTDTPEALLSLYGNTSTNTRIMIDEDGTGDPYLHLRTTDAQDWSVGIDNSDADKFMIGSDNAPGTDPHLVIDTTGNVGIGTTEPAKLLEISSTTAANLMLTADSGSSGNEYNSEINFRYRGTTKWSLGNDGADAFMLGTTTCDTATKLTVLASGNVGIGTDSPSVPLHIALGEGTDPTYGTGTLAVFQNNDDASDDCNITLVSGTAGNSRVLFGDSGDDDIGMIDYDNNINSMGFGTTDSVKMTILTGGNVGIGTAAPNKNTTTIGNETVLEIRGGDGTDTGFGCAGALYLTSAQDAVVDGNVLGYIGFIGTEDDSGGDAILPGAAIWAEAEGTYDTTGNETALCFSTATSSTAVATANERMRIDKDGKVGIGIAPSYALDTYVSGASYAARFRNSGDDVARHGVLVVAGKDDGSTAAETSYFVASDGDEDTVGSLGHNTSGNFVINATSDARIKKDIADTKINGLEIVEAIKLREFTKIKGNQFDKAGFIAQELKDVWSQAVGGTETDVDENGKMKPMTVSYASLIPPLVKAIQELSAKVTALENA